MNRMDLSVDTLWFEVAVVCGLTALGGIYFGHFEEKTPKIRRVVKLLAFNSVAVMLSVYAGREWSFGFIGCMLLFVAYVHGIWLPSKGINGLTGEPREKYNELRGWK